MMKHIELAEMDRLMTAQEIANLLRVHVTSVLRWTRTGKLYAFKVGGRGDWRYRLVDVTQFLEISNAKPDIKNSNK